MLPHKPPTVPVHHEFSGLTPLATDFIEVAVADNYVLYLANVVFASSIRWKGEVAINGTAQYTLFGLENTSHMLNLDNPIVQGPALVRVTVKSMEEAGGAASIYSTLNQALQRINGVRIGS